jgi:hypothetical protein
VAVVTALVFGLAPALQSTRPDLAPALKDQAGALAGGARQARFRKALVAAQVALSLLLLVGAGLFVRSLMNLRRLGPGFPTERLLAFNLDPSLNAYKVDQSKVFYKQLTEELGALPGVKAVGLPSVGILQDNEWDSGVTVEGHARGPEENTQAFMNSIGPGYFTALGVPIVAGRDFTVQDTEQIKHRSGDDDWTPRVVMVNEKFARRFFGEGNPLGRRVGFGTDPGTPTDMEIVGVIKDIQCTTLRDEIPAAGSRQQLTGALTLTLVDGAPPAQVAGSLDQTPDSRLQPVGVDGLGRPAVDLLGVGGRGCLDRGPRAPLEVAQEALPDLGLPHREQGAQQDLDAAVLPPARVGVVRRLRAVLRVPGGREHRGVDPGLVLEVAGHVDRPRRGQLPVRREALGEGAPDGDVVRVALHLDTAVGRLLQDRPDLPQHLHPGRLEVGLAGVEEHLVHHVDAELVPDPLHLDLVVGDLLLQLPLQLVLGGPEGGQLLLPLRHFLLELGARLLELVANALEVGHPAAQGRDLPDVGRGLLAGGVQRLLMRPVQPPIEGPDRGQHDQEQYEQCLRHRSPPTSLIIGTNASVDFGRTGAVGLPQLFAF